MIAEEANTVQSDKINLGQGIPTLDLGEIHLWAISLISHSALVEGFKAALTDLEREHISYYKDKQAQKSYVISQGGLRLFLSFYLNIEPPKIQLRKHAKGKPFVADDTSLYFNTSNSGEYVVYAFSRAGEVGIDIEKLRKLPDLEELIDRNFLLREQLFINEKNTSKFERFFRFWTVKECYLKAIGEGMRLAPDHVEFSVEKNCFKLQAVDGVFEQEDWLFKEIALGAQYVGTLAYKGITTKIDELRFI